MIARKLPRCGPDCLRSFTVSDMLALAEGTFVDDPAKHADCNKPIQPFCLPFVRIGPRVEYVHATRSFRIRSDVFRGDIKARSLRTLSDWDGFIGKCRPKTDPQRFE